MAGSDATNNGDAAGANNAGSGTSGGSAGLARNAGLLALGNVGSRVLGLVREMVIAALFGAGGPVSAFRIAAQVPNLVYDLLVGGMLSAALVPVLSRTAARRDGSTGATDTPVAPEDPQDALRVLVRTLIGAFGLALALLTLLLMIGAPWLTGLLAGGFARNDPSLLPLTAQMIRIMAPAVWFFSMAGLLTAVLYSLQRFSIPALGAALFNLGIVIATPLLARQLGILAAAIGVLAGSLLQASVMAWDVRRAGLSLRPRLDLRHPALRRILVLYLPIAAGLVVMLVQVTIDRRLASGTGESSIAWMAAATTLQQMPLGLISVALSLAALPTLSRHFAAHDERAFRATLGRGLRMVIMLLLPAAVGLALLAEPTVRLLFQRGAFTPADTQAVVAALYIYLIGMLFAGIDFPLNYASYARNNTVVPALVGVGSVGVYLLVAFLLRGPLTYLDLVWADTAKQAAHALVMLAFLGSALGIHQWSRLLAAVARPALAAGAMALTIALVDALLRPRVPAGAWGDLARLAAAGLPGLLVYGAALRLMHVEEALLVWRHLPGRRIIRDVQS
jgi:putative peptidoglycan lipid II flippase